jgi:hypothetical protein
MDTNLRDFVRQVLLDLTMAVQEAKDLAPVAIAPGIVDKKIKSEPQLVHFDLSVSSTTTKSAKDKMGGSATIVTIFRAEAGSESAENSSVKETNRIKFSVPVYFQAYLPRHENFKK